MKRILLITPHSESHRTAEETLALGYMASVLRNGNYHVEIIDAWLMGYTLKEIFKKICKFNPDVVGMSCYFSGLEQAGSIIDYLVLNFPSTPLIAGGYGPTFHPQEFINRGFTVSVRGEAEHVIIPLIKSLLYKQGLENIPGIVYKSDNNFVQTTRTKPIDLNQLPLPARDTIKKTIQKRNFVHINTSRGCTAYCTFCSIAAFGAKSGAPIWRQRSISNIIDEIEHLYNNYHVRDFKIVDDSFIEPPREEEWANLFHKELKSRNLTIRFRTQVRADRLTEKIIKSLSRAGWFSTSLGVENAAQSALQRMNKKASYKDNEKVLNLLEENGIYVQMGMILFDPDTTLEELMTNLKFLQRHKWPFTKGIFTEMYAADGTLFTRRASREGILLTSRHQNHTYKIKDRSAQRVYNMLKNWHKAHCQIYDYVIDPLTAPKSIPNDTFKKIHKLCQKLQKLDLSFFSKSINRVIDKTSSSIEDDNFVDIEVYSCKKSYEYIHNEIIKIYLEENMLYEAVKNPFLMTE